MCSDKGRKGGRERGEEDSPTFVSSLSLFTRINEVETTNEEQKKTIFYTDVYTRGRARVRSSLHGPSRIPRVCVCVCVATCIRAQSHRCL